MSARADGPAVIIGTPRSLFPRALASHWRSLGMEVVLVTRQMAEAETALEDGVRVLSTEPYESEDFSAGIGDLSASIAGLEEEIRRLDPKRHEEALAAWGEPEYQASLVAPVVNGIAIARVVRSLAPRFVFGMEAFAYGLATALCEGLPRILMPWGADVYLFAEMSPLAFALMKYVLRRVDLVVPTSVVAARHIAARFELPDGRTRPLSWGVDTGRFRRADPEERPRILERFGIDPAERVCLNARRFRPAWGSREALAAFLRLAPRVPSCRFVLLGGAGGEAYLAEARREIARADLASRFLLLEGDAPLEDCAALMSISDVAVSLMRTPDMRSFSVLQAAASGAALVLAEQPEYREMERAGCRAAFVDPTDTGAVAGAVEAYLADPAGCSQAARSNRAFILEHEDSERQMTQLLELNEHVARRYRAHTQSRATGAGREIGSALPEVLA